MLNAKCESPASVISLDLLDEILADLDLGDGPFPDPGCSLNDDENDELDAACRTHGMAPFVMKNHPAHLNKFRPISDAENSGHSHKKKMSHICGDDTCAVSPSSPSLCHPHTQSITRPNTHVSTSTVTPSILTPAQPLINPLVSIPLISGKSGMTFEQELAWLDDYIRADTSSPATPTAAPVLSVRPETWLEKIERWEAERLAALRAPIITLPARWRALTAAQQYVAAARVPDAMALSLNLSANVEKGARAHPDSLAYVVKRVNRYLSAAGLSGTPYALSLEVSGNDKLHLHGVVLVEGADLANLKRALMKAGGKISGKAGSRQVKLEPITDPDGWASYTGKDRKLTAKTIPGRRLVSLSQAMSRIARQRHEAGLPAPKPRKRCKA